jgi:translation initiation factor IF-2
VVLEARQEVGLGAVATVLIQRGTLRVGDDFIAGGCSGKVRSLRNERGEPLAAAAPSQPCLVAGLDGVPKAGDLFLVGEDRTVLRNLAEARMKLGREKTASKFDADMRARNLKALSAGVQKELKEINVVIKADVQGSAEALASSLAQLLKEDAVGAVQVKVLFAGVGDVSQSDVALAGVSGAWVIGFNVAATFQAMEDARARGLEVR